MHLLHAHHMQTPMLAPSTVDVVGKLVVSDVRAPNIAHLALGLINSSETNYHNCFPRFNYVESQFKCISDDYNKPT